MAESCIDFFGRDQVEMQTLQRMLVWRGNNDPESNRIMYISADVS